MSPRRFRRVRAGFCTVLCLGGLGLLVARWLRVAYTVPPEPSAPILPRPNAYDTLLRAGERAVLEQDGVHAAPGSPSAPIRSLAARQRLVRANAPAIQQVRQALEQRYLRPPYRHGQGDDKRRASHRELARLLIFAAETCEEAGDPTEASRYATDAFALGIVTAQGGGNLTQLSSFAIESLGNEALWKLADRLDAPTCRALGHRLEALEQDRWSAAQALEREFEGEMPTARALFREGPLATWRYSAEMLKITEGAPEGVAAVWWRARVVLGGWRSALEPAQRWNAARVRFTQQPYGQRTLPAPPAWNPLGGLFETMGAAQGLSPHMEANAALLRTYLALRAYWREHGAYPESLDALARGGYLKTVPADPFSPTRSRLGYRRGSDRTMTLWSVGPDAKDDGGKAVEVKDSDSRRRRGVVDADALGDIVARGNTY